MVSSEELKVLNEAESLLGTEVQRVELLGEIEIAEDKVILLAKALGAFGVQMSQERWPHCFAVCLVGIARFRYDGDSFWPHVGTALGAGLQGHHQVAMGQWFEGYLARNRLPTLSHLVEQGALRYLTPILAHALVPRALVPDFMESVIWRSIQNPLDAGASGEEIQQRMARVAPNLPRALLRFVVHGGRVARDVIDRSLLAAVGVSDDGAADLALPGWLKLEIQQWVEARSAGERVRALDSRRPSRRRPCLKLDPGFTRVILELPYGEEPGCSWEVQLPNGGIHHEPWKPAWQRTGPTVGVVIDRPFVALTARLMKAGTPVGSWTFDGLTEKRPGIFFEARSHQASGSSGFLSGTRWYVLAPAGSDLLADGNRMDSRERLGQPLGDWQGLVVDYYEVPEATEVRLEVSGASARYRLVHEQPNAYVEESSLPGFLAPQSEGLLAFEQELPAVVLPAHPEGADEVTYLSRWTLRMRDLSGSDDAKEVASAMPRESMANGAFRIRLEELIPGPDVGDWQLDVVGPLGRGLNTRISLLPQMEFDVEEQPGIAGPELRASSVLVRTRDGIRVIEAGDSAAPTLEGWRLHDLNRNGLIPFTVLDTRTGREATALVRLGVVRWQWLVPGTRPRPANTPERLSLDEIEARAFPHLLVSNPGTKGLVLSLLDGAGRVRQEETSAPAPGRGTTFSLAPFLTTAMSLGSPSLTLRLELVSPDGSRSAGSNVGLLVRQVALTDFHVGLQSDRTIVSWRQSRPYPDTVVRIVSLTRPWEGQRELSVTELEGRQRAEIDGPPLPPGRYGAGLWYDDGWVGLASLGPTTEFVIGNGDELREHAIGLPPTVKGSLERALLLGDADDRRRAVAELATGMDPHQMADLVDTVARALERGNAAELLSLPWDEAAASLTGLENDPLPLLAALSTHADAPELPRFCAAIGLDRWPALLKAVVPAPLVPGLWAAWPPAGAFVDLAAANLDAVSASRCEDQLGWSPGEVLTCFECGAPIGTEGPCRSCGSESVKSEPRPLPDAGAAEGLVFNPEPALLSALRQHLSPIPCAKFHSDGWVMASLSTLEKIAAGDVPQLERERDAFIADYRLHLVGIEKTILSLVQSSVLDKRDVKPAQYPWAYLARVSLAVALMRRLMARRKLALDSAATSVLDRLAAWLELYFAPVYERDLCFAEILCCRKFEWT